MVYHGEVININMGAYGRVMIIPSESCQTIVPRALHMDCALAFCVQSMICVWDSYLDWNVNGQPLHRPYVDGLDLESPIRWLAKSKLIDSKESPSLNWSDYWNRKRKLNVLPYRARRTDGQSLLVSPSRWNRYSVHIMLINDVMTSQALKVE